MKKYIAFLWLCMLSSCIKPFDIDVDEGNKRLVVNGLVTDEPGPYTVKLNRTTSFGDYFSDGHVDVLNAYVTITDDLGFTERLKEVGPGQFRTSANGLRGRVGGSYSLYIRLQNGEEFTAESGKMLPVPPIERFYYDVKEVVTLDENNYEQRKPYFELLIDAPDPATEKNFYRWSSVATYEVETQPEDYVEYGLGGTPIPKPKDCCRQCWVTRVDNRIVVTSDRQFNGNKLLRQPVTSVAIAPEFLDMKYHVMLKQYSLSESAYTFWKMLESQTEGTGSVQDPAPANAYGNILNVNKPEENGLGIFGASAVASKEIYLTRSDVPFLVGDFVYPNDCREITRSTTIRPDFWQ